MGLPAIRRDPPSRPVSDDEDLRLHHKRDWLNGNIEKAMRKRRYPHIVWGDDDLPRWKRIAIDIVVGVFLASGTLALLVGAAYLKAH